MEFDTSAEKDVFHKNQMETFAIQAEQTIEAQRHLYIQEAGEELRRKEDAHGRLVNFLEDQLQNRCLESSSQNSAYEAIEHESQRF